MWKIAVVTHRGRLRAANEDSVSISGEITSTVGLDPITRNLSNGSHVLTVADGIGGHVGGALASRSALQSLSAVAPDDMLDQKRCTLALISANDDLYDLMRADPACAGMGTTLVGAAISNGRLLVFNVGDSRCYLHSAGELLQLSIDDVPPMAIGASRVSRSHVITQSLGGALRHKPIQPHISTMPSLAIGETLLLCSDGLTDMLSDDMISGVFNEINEVKAIATELNRLAMRAGGRDNISIVVVQRAAP